MNVLLIIQFALIRIRNKHFIYFLSLYLKLETKRAVAVYL